MKIRIPKITLNIKAAIKDSGIIGERKGYEKM
jgi:hypothetical protein